jgi:hypothetical protein
VYYWPAERDQNAARGIYQIISLLPQREDGEFEYRIRIWTSSTSGLLKKVSYGAAATHEPRNGTPPPASVRRGAAEAGVKGKAPDWSSG